jgi:teichuronic acid biosynthesis glycosyltransferase TuaG
MYNYDNEEDIPEVSVILTTYNRPGTLLRSIDSILSQNFHNFELIIIDDGSEKETRDIILKINDYRIKYYRFKNFGRPAKPRNEGIKRARGKYVAFCDDDDIWMQNKIQYQINLIKEKKVHGIFTNAINIDYPHEYGELSNNKSGHISLRKLLSKNHFILSTSFIDKTIFESIKFNEDEVFKGSEDFILWVNCLSMNKKFYYSSKPTVKYQIQNQSSIRSSINLKNMHKIHFNHVSKLIIAKNLNLLLIPYYAFFQMLRTFKYTFK